MAKILYYTAYHYRGEAFEKDIVGPAYSTYDEAKKNLHYYDDEDNAILANIDGVWYRAFQYRGEDVTYRGLYEHRYPWRTLSEILGK